MCVCSPVPGSRGRTQPELTGASSPARRPAHAEGVGRMLSGVGCDESPQVLLAFGGAAQGPGAGSGWVFKWSDWSSLTSKHSQGARRGWAGAISSAQGRRRGFAEGTNKDSPERQLNESLWPWSKANAAGTESELFAEVFHQINDIILCWSSPIYALSAPRQLCLNSDIQASICPFRSKGLTRQRKLLNEAFEGKAGTVCASRPRSSPGQGPGCPHVLRLLGGLGEGQRAPGCSWPRDRGSRADWGPAGIPHGPLDFFSQRPIQCCPVFLSPS